MNGEMRLWILMPTDQGGDLIGDSCVRKFVVRARTEGEARSLAQSQGGRECWLRGRSFWDDPERSMCIPLSTDGKVETISREYISHL